ncbi:MAG: sensor histidine kinase [Myxacorys chilensis ATA2-1-KO14]|jgi:signal transduction histidine kinase|nr:sensor histidine kinase [Myxacorys chilensis ATA2-1-KO14]
MLSEAMEQQVTIEALEKENRILRKKLERAEATCLQLEDTNQKKETLLRQVIEELKDSQRALEEQRRELEQMLIDLNRVHAQLVQTEKMSSLGQLVAGVAHEINNPVNFIYGNLSHVEEHAQNLLDFLQLYQNSYPNPTAEIEAKAEAIDLEFVQEDLPKILDSMQLGTDRIRQIVLSLRNFSRMDEAEYKAVDLHKGIDSTLLILQHRLKGEPKHSAIALTKNYGDLPLVECYVGPLNQVFMNILANAIDALEEVNVDRTDRGIQDQSNRITICTKVVDTQWVQVTISDNGPGIPEAIQQKIFDPFFTTKPIGKGTGMGMSISYQIVTEKHGGKLECLSSAATGTEFVIQIPIKQQIQSAL